MFIEGIKQQQRTQYLYLRENLLETIPQRISLKYVKIVDVSFNRLHSINFIGYMPLLIQLNARGNLIEPFADISLSPSLEYLIISMNPITSLVGLDQLPNLRFDPIHLQTSTKPRLKLRIYLVRRENNLHRWYRRQLQIETKLPSSNSWIEVVEKNKNGKKKIFLDLKVM
ncbi:MAG: hypothetical protein EZS28_020098 [Streblomastix strix]|uniref:Uncharacterized protein n=1 Tax=Streblomastix strix TaxID=222440 RepID=A0A5J4VQ23_9EUKA|nr:MAG: hypothetical protein EZS28_020098 [Streblomastix strix]